MSRRTLVVSAVVAALLTWGCGGEIINGFTTYGSGRLQGFVTRTDGTPVPDIQVFASFGPDAFGLGIRTDQRGLYEIEGLPTNPSLNLHLPIVLSPPG